MGIGSIAEAHLLARKHFKFYGCEAHELCLFNEIQFTIAVFIRKLFDVDFDINEPKKTKQAAKMYLKGEACAVEYH